MSDPVNAKVCVKCGANCSGKPRTKDAQGKYTCKPCFDAAHAAAKSVAKPAAKPAPQPKPAPEPEPADDAALMASLLESSPSSLTEMCPSCGSGMAEGAVVCTICGYNKQTGRAMGVKVQKAEKAPRTGPGLSDVLLNPMYTGVAAVAVFGSLLVWGLSKSEAGAALYVLGALLYGFTFGILVLVDAFRQDVWTGVKCLVVPIYSLYYLLSVCERPMIKVHGLLASMVMLGVYAVGPVLDNASN